MFRNISIHSIFPSVLILALAFFLGGGIGKLSQRQLRPVSTPAQSSWGLSFQEDGQPPTANASADYLKQFHAWYIGQTDEKVIYLTFDAGYENGNTEAILDALKKHSAPAAFFLVGNYISTAPDLVKRMAQEGHIIGNHTFHHPDMSQISSQDAFQKELTDLEKLYEETTGQPLKKYYRPPQGIYNEENLKMARDLGYQTIFWSLAYVDWYEEDQPTKEEAFEKLLGRIHPGAIVLLHSTSKTNGEILDELLTRWEEMGYTFRSLDQLTSGQAGGYSQAPSTLSHSRSANQLYDAFPQRGFQIGKSRSLLH